jgi:predicted TPR repeat methyltransferase
MVAAGSRAVPERAADQYVADLFDGFAESFDSTLIGLGYRIPQVLSMMIQAERGDDATPLRILDAGCGTGLAASLLKPLASQLVGVDLSPKMLAKAQERMLYDELVVAELCAFMASRPAAFELIILADTLVYFGALEEAFSTAYSTLTPGGIFSFAVEARPADVTGPDYRLEPHGRYSHHPDYVTRLLDASGFTLRKIDNVVIRRELNADVAGIAVVARRNAA